MEPPLEAVKPGRKRPLKSAESFEKCVTTGFHNQLNCIQHCDGVFTIDGVLTEAECAQLCHEVRNCDDLSFWNTDTDNLSASRAFRNADTIEINSNIIAEVLWRRIASLSCIHDINITSECSELFDKGIYFFLFSIFYNIMTKTTKECKGVGKQLIQIMICCLQNIHREDHLLHIQMAAPSLTST
jgi:hypothetical protein